MNIETSLGHRIAQCALDFVGTAYDPDPLGSYVRKGVLVLDDPVDCMYLVFRSVEKAMGPSRETDTALHLRFKSRGIVEDGRVKNYNERFQYGMDMIRSGKWGVDITARLGPLSILPPTRRGTLLSPDYRGPVAYASKEFLFSIGRPEIILPGDIIFFIVTERSREYSEAVGHMGIAAEEGPVNVVHASGTKKDSAPGEVRVDPLGEYLDRSRFRGIKVTRFMLSPMEEVT